MRVSTALTTTILLLIAGASIAQNNAPLRVLASNGMKAVIDELRPRLQQAAGRPLAIEFNTSAAVRQRIEAGENFDVAVLTAEVINELAKTGKIASGSTVDLGRSGIGFGVRTGAAKPDVATPEAVKRTLLNAKSLTWVSVGASRVHIDRMLEGLGIASEVKAKTVLTPGVDESVALVADGKNEMIVTLTSEILPAKGVQYVGPLPAKFQSYVAFAAGLGPKASASGSASSFIKTLAAPTVARVYESKGMELPIVGVPERQPARAPTK